MPLNLTELIKASGNAGTVGQSFKSQVTGAADTISMASYKVGNLAISGTLPVNSTELPGAYTSGTNFNAIVVGINSYGANAANIRKSGTTGFTLGLTGGGSGASVLVNSFSEVAPDDFDLDITIYGKLSPVYTIVGAADNSLPGTWGISYPWNWTFTATQQAPSGGPDVMYLDISYDHDTANFNTLKTWSPVEFSMARRSAAVSEMRFRWFDNGTDAAANTNPISDGVGSGYSTIAAISYGLAHPSNLNFDVWLRWTIDLTGATGWSSAYGPTSITGENRNEA